MTTMVRTVKGGSSSRPRRKNANVPASDAASMQKTTNERRLIAHSERFGPITVRGAGRAGGLLAGMERLHAGGDHDVARRRARRDTTTRVRVVAPTSIGRSDTVRSAGSTTHTAGCAPGRSAAAGDVDARGSRSTPHAADHGGAQPHRRRRIGQAHLDLERAA